MVRRWSYINTTNKLLFKTAETLLTVSSGLNINATRYFYWKTFQYTVLTRVQWARRRHLTQWLFFTNILFLWTSEYSFYRRHGSYVRTTNLFKHNYTSFNFITLKYVALKAVKSSETFVAAAWYPRLQTFYTNRRFLNQVGSFNPYFTCSSVSTPLPSSKLSTGNVVTDLDTPWVNQSVSSIGVLTSASNVNVLKSLFQVFFSKNALQFCVAYYKLLTYLFVTKLFDFGP